MSQYYEGCYYYTLVKFDWGSNAISKFPSIYVVKDENVIEVYPPIKEFMKTEKEKVMFFPFIWTNRKVIIKDG